MQQSDLGYIEKQFRDYTTTGWCKSCRQYDLLFRPDMICLDCMKRKKSKDAESALRAAVEKETK